MKRAPYKLPKPFRKPVAKAALFRADVAKEDEVTAMFERIIEIFGRIDICVPNSGIQLKARIDEMTLAQWQRVIDVNLTGMFPSARVRRFVRSKDRGST